MVGVLPRKKDLGRQSLRLCLGNPRPGPLNPICAISSAVERAVLTPAPASTRGEENVVDQRI